MNDGAWLYFFVADFFGQNAGLFGEHTQSVLGCAIHQRWLDIGAPCAHVSWSVGWYLYVGNS